jgi:hypothetical protein
MNRKYTYLIFFLMLMLLPWLVFADCKANSNVWNISILKGPLITCTGAGATGGTDNTNCQSLCDLICTSANVVYFGIGVVIWIIAPIMFAWSGILFILARGSPDKTSQAKKMITATVIGLLIVICAYLIVYVFVKTLGITGIGGFGTPSCTIQ